MAARINTRFLLILIIVVGGIGAAIAGFVMFGQEKTAEDHIESARKFRNANSWVLAGSAYARALGVESTSRTAIDEWRTMLLEEVRPDNATEASDFLESRVNLLTHEAAVFPDDASKHEALLSYLEEMAAMQVGRYVRLLEEGGANMRDAVAGEAADRGLYYEGLGLTHEVLWNAMREEDQRRGLDLLDEYVEAAPEDGRGHYRRVEALVRWFEKADGQTTRQSRLSDLFDAGDAALRSAGEDPWGLSAAVVADLQGAYARDETRVRWIGPDGTELPDRRTADRTPGAIAELRPAVRERVIANTRAMVRLALERIEDGADDRVLPLMANGVTRTVGRVIGTDALGDEADAVPVLRAWIERHPEELVHRVELISRLRVTERFDEAIDEADALLALDRPTTSTMAVIRAEARTATVEQKGLSIFGLWNEAEDDAERARLAAQLEATVEAARAETDDEDDPRVLSLAARAAYVDGDAERAAALYDRIIRDALAPGGRGTVDVDLLFQASEMYARAGQVGTAVEALDRALVLSPGNPALASRRAEFLVQLDRLGEAEAQLSDLRQGLLARLNSPGVSREVVAQQVSRIEARLRDVRERILTQGGEVASGSLSDREITLSEAKRAWNEQRIEDALAAAQRVMDADPAAVDRTMAEAIAVRVAGLIELGRDEEACGLVARGLEIGPNIPALRRAKIICESGDELDRIRRLIDDQIQDPAQRAVMLVEQFSRLADVYGENAASDELAPQERETNARLAERAETELAAVREDAEALAAADRGGPVDRALARFDFRQALEAADVDAAEAIASRAAEDDLDQCAGHLFRGRVLLRRAELAEDPRDAASLRERSVVQLEEASRMLPFSAEVSLHLSRALRLTGDRERALVEIQRAYQSDPTDRLVVSGFQAALAENGDVRRAADVARQAARGNPGDLRQREAWLSLERRAGRTDVVLRERRRIRAESPQDVTNLVQLADVLAQERPTRATLIGDDGAPRFTVDRWQGLPADRRQELLAEARRDWADEWETVIGDVRGWLDGRVAEGVDPASEWGSRVALASLRASGLRALGRTAEATALLESTAADADPGLHRYVARLVLADHFEQNDQPARKIDVLEAAVADAPEGEVTARLLIGGTLLRFNRIDGAVEAFDEVVAALEAEGTPLTGSFGRLLVDPLGLRVLRRQVPVEEVQLDLARALVRTTDGRDRAGRIVAALDAALPPSFPRTMLEATLLEVELVAARGAGDEARTAELRESLEQTLVEAESLAQGSIEPQLVRAGLRQSEWLRTGDDAQLQEALDILNLAQGMAPDDRRVVLRRVDVLQALGDLEAAATALDGLLDVAPEDDEVRNRLVAILGDLGRDAAQRQAIEEAVRLYQPRREAVRWMVLLGQYLEGQERFDEAAEVYDGAWTIARRVTGAEALPNPIPLAGWASAQLSLERPDARTVIRRLDASARSPEARAVDFDPSLALLLARAQKMLGQDSAAARSVEDSYGRMRDRIAEELVPPSRMSTWVENARAVFDGDIEEVERTIVRLAGGEIDPVDASGLAAGWLTWAGGDVARRGRAVVRADELLERAVSEVPAGDAMTSRRLRALLWNQRAALLLERGRSDEAAAAFMKVLEDAPASPGALNNAAFLIATELDDPERALPLAQQAVQLAPSNWAVVDTLGRVLQLAGRPEQAEQALRRSISLRRRPENLHHLALLALETDRLEAAQTHITEAAALLDRFDDVDRDVRDEIRLAADDIRRRIEGGG